MHGCKSKSLLQYYQFIMVTVSNQLGRVSTHPAHINIQLGTALVQTQTLILAPFCDWLCSFKTPSHTSIVAWSVMTTAALLNYITLKHTLIFIDMIYKIILLNVLLRFVVFLCQVFCRGLAGDLDEGKLFAVSGHVARRLTHAEVIVLLYQEI